MTGGEKENRPRASPTETEELEHMLIAEEDHDADAQSDENIQGSKVGEVVTEAVEGGKNKNQ